MPPYLTIPEVVSNKDLKFFKVPRLGSYLAIKLEYKSCLSEKAMDDAMAEEEKYMAAVADIEAEREEWEKAEDTKRKEMEEAGTLDEYEHEPWPVKNPPEKPAFLQHAEQFVIGLDTLGQDRAFTQDEIRFALETV